MRITRLQAAAAALVTALACTTALGQGAPPANQTAAPASSVPGQPGIAGLPLGGTPRASASAKASAAPRGSAAPSSSGSALPAGHPPTGDLPPGHPPTGDLPPGHPPTGDMPPGHPPTGDLPPGHPPTGGGDDDDDDDAPSGNPHAGMQGNPHGGGGQREQLFDAPPDTAEDDQTLPVGTIVLMLRDANEKPLPATDVTLGIVHNTVATGESRERKTGTTDGEGTVRWDGLAHGSGTSYRTSVARDSAIFWGEPFALGDRAGKRVVLHVYPVSTNIDKMLIGTQGFIYIALREDSIVLENMYGIINVGAVAWVPENQTLELPDGYKAYNRPDSMDGVGVDEVNGKGLLRGTIGPGRHEIRFRYQVPLEQDDKQTIKIQLPPHMMQMQVMVEASKTMGAEVKGFPAARKDRNRDGKRVLVLAKGARDPGSMKELEITLTGLPTAGPGRWVAAILGVLALIFGGAYVAQRSGQKGPDAETRADLVDAREALLREMVELERAHRAGEIGPKTYERLRNALLDAIERLMTKIAEATPRRPRSRVADMDEYEA